jgi:hypothetical protein
MQLSENDVLRIVEAIRGDAVARQHACRFHNIDEETMHEAVMFFKNFNNAFNKTGNIIWTTLLVAGVGGLIGLLVIGFTTKFKAGGGP